jgi:hypothetical protein
MLQFFRVKNFRCFSELKLQPLSRINLIAGKNNTGKTALLEAIRLYCDPGNCLLPIDINKERGIETPMQDYEDVVSWLFFDRNPTSAVDFISQDDRGKTHSLTIHLVDLTTFGERFPEAEKGLREHFGTNVNQANGPLLVLEFKEPNDEKRMSVGFSTGGGFSWVGQRSSWRASTNFIHSGTPSSSRDIQYFGELEAAKRQPDILPALQVIEPRLQRLALVPFAGQTVIHGDVGLSRLMPIPFMGEGLRRLLSIVLAIANTRGRIILIDEVENGLHYSVMKDVWLGIAQAARQADVQVFATTHSYECIQAAHQAGLASPVYDFGLFRLDRVQGEGIRATVYDQTTLDTSIEMNLEVR